MRRSVLILFLCVFSSAASAQFLGYQYVQAGLGKVDIDSSLANTDGDGLSISGSMIINNDFHVSADYQTTDLDSGGDLDLLEIRGGYHTTISPNLDIVGEVGYAMIEHSGVFDSSGFVVGLGLRGGLNSNMELYGGLDYVNLDDIDSQTRANAGFLLNLTENLGLGLRATLWDDFNQFQVTARFYF